MPTNEELVINNVTDGSLDGNDDWKGTGIFDVLMDAVNQNINSQYKKNRITGSDFANVYLGSVQAVLQQSVEYYLRRDKIEADTALTLANTTVLEAKSAEEILNIQATTALTIAQTSVFEDKSVEELLILKSNVTLAANSIQIELDKIGIAKDAAVEDLLNTQANTTLTTLNTQVLTDKTVEELLILQANVLLSQESIVITRDKAAKDLLSVVAGTTLTEANTALTNINAILSESNIKVAYVERVLKDKQAAELGLDQVVKTSNTDPSAVYQPKYTEL
jgi:hypothetical protein